ncbi:MAG: NUDIX domain-containing protein [Clostridia bacterium]|nr:NUDIX domain-containing protein [Clostridia bacterium]
MIKITWKTEKVPAGIPITQVYGLIFDKNGRMLLKVENKNGKTVYSLAGGTPEDFDADAIATLRRELTEEINTTVGADVRYVGYQLIEGDGDRPPYAQMRMTAIIEKIGEKLPDPDNGEIYDRLLTSPERAVELLNWGNVGKAQIMRAVEIATAELSLPSATDNQEIWI